MKTPYQRVVAAEMPEFAARFRGPHHRFHLNVEARMLKFAAHPAEPDPARVEAGVSHEFRLSLLAARSLQRHANRAACDFYRVKASRAP
jgi:hypothetical protein